MSCSDPHPYFNLDPWSASSLLQKAIRRGEVSLAQTAATAFRRFRGSAIWRRLITIAVEDVGIADIALVHDLVRVGTDKTLRELLGPDDQLISEFCARMARATKDRSTDYVYCAATKLETAAIERDRFSAMPAERLVEIACDPAQPLVRRAVAAMSATLAERKTGDRLDAQRVEAFLLRLPARSSQVEEILLQLVSVKFHSFCLMLPLVWAQWWQGGAESEVVHDHLLPSPRANGVPLYTFDKHTVVGRRALSRFSREDGQIRDALERWVPHNRRIDVTLMAAFYADAIPVAKRLQWSDGYLFHFIGLHADMMAAGCPCQAVTPMFECVRRNLGHANQLRIEVLRGKQRHGIES
jgi:hypothetical protein